MGVALLLELMGRCSMGQSVFHGCAWVEGDMGVLLACGVGVACMMGNCCGISVRKLDTHMV